MAEMQDVMDEDDVGELETVEQQDVQQQRAEQHDPADDVPEKYRGKSVLDIVKMHQDTERSLSKQGQELGEIRKLADDLLRSQLQASKPKEAEVPKVDLFENPDEYVRNAVANNPSVLEARQYAQQARQLQIRQQLQQAHPDFAQIMQDQDFGQWISASPVRQQMLRHADQNFDFATANELLSTFKELKKVRSASDTKVEEAAKAATIKAAAVDTGGSGESTKKIYRRADLIRLKMRDPEKYATLADSGELAAAYSEGRVR